MTTNSPDLSASAPSKEDQYRQLRRPPSQSRLSSLMVPGRSRSGSTASQNSVNVEDGGATGRITPEGRRRAGKAATTSLLANDAKYKKFRYQVDKSLQSFESINEWADFISFLSRLLKTLQSQSPPYNEIPRKLIVGKRLAQCLNPALPSGVHQRALDVYAYIFSIIGVDGLERDLTIWSSGLFPFFQYAATSVRPLLINIYETYYLPLQVQLRPATKAFILALLPGIEEESGDFFDKILFLLDRLSGAVTPTFFLQNTFLILITSSTSRLSALNYLSRRMLKPPDHPEATVETGLLIRGFAAVLGDDNMLVRRSGLELLLRVLKLDSGVYKSATDKDKELLMRAVTDVVLQKELSLSRRVYTWLLGPGDTPTDQLRFFKSHGLDLLASTVLTDMLELETQKDRSDNENGPDLQRPFKVFLSLLDKWEVGVALSRKVTINALRIVRRAQLEGTPGASDTASALYDAVEPTVIWKDLSTAVIDEVSGGEAHDLELILWLLRNVPQTDEEVTNIHVPSLLQCLLAEDRKNAALSLAVHLIETVPTTILTRSSTTIDWASDSPPVSQVLYSEDRLPETIESRIQAETLPSIIDDAFAINMSTIDATDTTFLLNSIRLVSALIESETPSLALVDGSSWLSAVVRGLNKVSTFVVVESLVCVALKASRCAFIQPPLDLTSETNMFAFLDSLFRYLRPSASLYHSRAVELLWDFNQLAEIHTLENVIARRMAQRPFNSSAFEAFGVFWRLTDDSMLPGEIFNVPICAVLDSLNSSDPNIQRHAETWLRLNLRSYLRVVDPIMSRLIDPVIKYNSSKGVYDGPVDLGRITYYIEAIATLFQFGGQGLSKTFAAQEFGSSLHSTFVHRAEGQFPEIKTYLELLVMILIRFLETEEDSRRGNTQPLVVRLQGAALSLLQTVVSRGDVPYPLLNDLKAKLVENLISAVQKGHLTLQSKMLHLLHSAIHASAPRRDHPSRVASHTHRRAASSIFEKPPPLEISPSEFEYQLVVMIMRGVVTPSNIPVLQHWVDFVLMTVPTLASRPALLHTLVECFSQETRELVQRMRDAHEKASGHRDEVIHDETLSVTDAEVVMTLNALERVLTLLGNQALGRADETPNPQTESGSRILGLVSNVFTVEAPSIDPKAESPRYLDDAIHALLVTWSATLPPQTSDALNYAPYEVIHSRAKRVLEKAFTAQPLAVMSSCVHVWSLCSEQVSDTAIFDCIDALTPSAQKVLELTCELASGKTGRMIPDYRVDPSYLAFLEAYVSRLEAPIAVQIWSTLFSFARDVAGGVTSSSSRAQLYPTLQCLTNVCLTISKTTALEDRRLRRDVQDIYVKLLDLVVSNVSKIAEGGIWDRTTMAKEDSEEDTNVEKGLEQIFDYLSSTIIPNLRALLVEADRVNSACSGIAVSIIAPAFRQQKVDVPILRLVLQLSHIPSATKTWRSYISDSFGDSRLFKTKPPIEVAYWKALVLALFDADKERFPDLLSRITSASSANINIFTNREQEMLVKCGNLRRLSLLLLSAERNHYLGQLPGIQERLVEMLRSSSLSARVHSDVYLCLRILMCRISPQHLANFWPVILAELLRIFEQTLDEPPENNSEDLQLVLAACKFLDLLLVIHHQWMFVTDTTDAAYPPEEFVPESIMDRLADVLSELDNKPSPNLSQEELVPLASPTTQGPAPLRRPRLSGVKTMTSLHQLQPFLARASMDTFESVYGDYGVDWDGIEESLTGEIFDA
ncbi:hypothetical protein L198_01584 [Cryptococcus wingfieldii CBS 7118]|uniref:Uncharacterized protein n=1 Tax=Cryptococcus wingfieldii CBS 7118 TaxID=1295528 RepID=A0A1E3K2B3_9TREE|nr:hypothetical protein L198_01584 [Cryptococcus wingfieldii CBS 7118]ODO06352.1 hypothetical protein L198_01584 [Cryptococcus wingfieldii CBS 7118]